jgi:hypothetical protein
MMVGQGNFAGGVNTEENHLATNRVPTVVGAPLLAHFVVSVRNSERIETNFCGEIMSSAAVTFFSNAADPRIPDLDHTVFLELVPLSSLDVQYLEPLDLPSMIGLGSLFFTASHVSAKEGGVSTSGKMMFDTGAQATLISRIAAAELNLDVGNPEFEVEVQGIAGSEIAPGFVVDELSVPAEGGAVVWSNVPVIVLNVGSPEGGTLFGIVGSNLFAYRDWVVNGMATPPYVAMTAPVVPPRLRFSAVRKEEDGTLELDWKNEPPPPVVFLEPVLPLRSGRKCTRSLHTPFFTPFSARLFFRYFAAYGL